MHPDLKALMEQCWAGKPDSRPTFDQVSPLPLLSLYAFSFSYLSPSSHFSWLSSQRQKVTRRLVEVAPKLAPNIPLPSLEAEHIPVLPRNDSANGSGGHGAMMAQQGITGKFLKTLSFAPPVRITCITFGFAGVYCGCADGALSSIHSFSPSSVFACYRPSLSFQFLLVNLSLSPSLALDSSLFCFSRL